MRQMTLLFALVAVVMVVTAVAASAHCYTVGANQPASVYTSCGISQPIVQHHAVKPVAHNCSTCGAPLMSESSGAAVFPAPTVVAVAPIATSCAAVAPVATTCAAAPSCAVAAPVASTCGACVKVSPERWSANLTALPGVSAVPISCQPCAVQPLPQGRADFQLTSQGCVLRYWVYANDINCINGAEIRLLGPGGDLATAPVVARLYGGAVRSGEFSGRLSRGNITSADLMGPLQGQPVSALVDAMNSGQAVVVVNTTTHPQGEIAGTPIQRNLA